jgi:hypothetical protein
MFSSMNWDATIDAEFRHWYYPKNSSCLTKVRWFRGIFAVGAG